MGSNRKTSLEIMHVELANVGLHDVVLKRKQEHAEALSAPRFFRVLSAMPIEIKSGGKAELEVLFGHSNTTPRPPAPQHMGL